MLIALYVAQAATGSVFAIACLVKWISPAVLADAVVHLLPWMAMLPRGHAERLSRLIATGEGLLSVALLDGRDWGPIVSVCFLIGASCVSLLLHHRGYHRSCGCFGGAEAILSSRQTMSMNALLFTLSCYQWWAIAYASMPFRPVWQSSRALLPIVLGVTLLGTGCALVLRAVVRDGSDDAVVDWQVA